jgi:hypothetical protein
MDVYSLLWDILKYTVSGVGVVWIAFYMIKPYLDRSDKIQLLELRKAVSNQTLPLRLQAYERLVLFIERVNPSNLLIRLNGPAYSAAELQAIVANEIRNEYQHNITQQIYVSTRTWATVRRIKDDTLNMVNSVVRSLPENASGLDLSKAVLTHLSTLENDPYDGAVNVIRKDLDEIF